MPRVRAPSRVGMRQPGGRVLLDCMGVRVLSRRWARTGRGRVVWAGKDRPRAVSGEGFADAPQIRRGDQAAGRWRLSAVRVLGLEVAVAGLAGDGGLGQGGGGDADGTPAGAGCRDEVRVAAGRGAGGGFAVP